MNRLKVRSNWRQANYLEIYFNKLGERQRIQLKQERTEKDGFEKCFYLGDRINSRTGCEDKGRRGRTPTSLAQERQNCRGCMQRKHTGLPFLWRAPPHEMRREHREFFPEHTRKGTPTSSPDE